MQAFVPAATLSLPNSRGAKLWALLDYRWKCIAGGGSLLMATVLVMSTAELGATRMCSAAEPSPPGVSSRAVLMNIGDLHLKIPIAYLPHRWRYVNSSTRTAVTTIGFALVMPDGRPATHVDPAWIVASQYELPESERGPGKFLVHIRNFTVIDDDQYVSPANKFRNRVMLGAKLLEPEFGLDWFSQRPVKRGIFGAVQQAEPEVIFDCMDQEAADRISPGLQPLCNGIVYYPSKRFEYRLGLPAERFAQWKEIVATTHKLLSSWIE